MFTQPACRTSPSNIIYSEQQYLLAAVWVSSDSLRKRRSLTIPLSRAILSLNHFVGWPSVLSRNDLNCQLIHVPSFFTLYHSQSTRAQGRRKSISAFTLIQLCRIAWSSLHFCALSSWCSDDTVPSFREQITKRPVGRQFGGDWSRREFSGTC